jgi:hypothetical protein
MPADHPLRSAATREPRLPLWLTYLWQRLHEHDRLGLVLGAGVSKDAGIPMWNELINRLAKAVGIPAKTLRQHKKEHFPETFLAEIFFRQHHTKEDKSRNEPRDRYHRLLVNSSWKYIVRECLYKDVETDDFDTIAKRHKYLKPLAELVCKSGFTVTFNFDDIVDQAVTARVEEILQAAPDTKIANPEIIYHPKIEMRKNAPVIYHINGSLPHDELRRGSEDIILTEDAFADVLLSPSSQDADFVINQFSLRTFLLIGISLSDNSLKNILRSSAKRNPANYHFAIFHENDDAPRSPEVKADIFNAYYNVYNLISIFLTTDEIRALIEILKEPKPDRLDNSLLGLGAGSTIQRKYYIVGSVASGKSSTIDALRCFTTFEEFRGRIPKEMYQDDTTLTPAEQSVVDEYLFPALISKNLNMVQMNSGIRIMDRAFLDLFAFSKDGDKKEIKRKATELKERVRQRGRPLESGHIFFLKASPDAIEERLLKRGARKAKGGKTGFEAPTLARQEKYLSDIYPIAAPIDTSDLDSGDVAKKIAKEILLGEYKEFDFAARLDEIIDKDGVL